MPKSRIKQFLADHPKLTSVLFTLFIYLSHVSTVIASGDGSQGP